MAGTRESEARAKILELFASMKSDPHAELAQVMLCRAAGELGWDNPGLFATYAAALAVQAEAFADFADLLGLVGMEEALRTLRGEV